VTRGGEAGAIDPYVKWYRLDFVTFNSNVGLFSYVRFSLELSNTGRCAKALCGEGCAIVPVLVLVLIVRPYDEAPKAKTRRARPTCLALGAGGLGPWYSF